MPTNVSAHAPNSAPDRDPEREDGDDLGRGALPNQMAAFSALVDQAKDGMAQVALDGGLVFANPAFRAIAGIGSTPLPRLVECLMDEDVATYQSVILPAFRTKGRWEGEFRLRHAMTGAAVPVALTLLGLGDQATASAGCAMLVSDLSARQDAERRLRERELELARVQRIGQVGGFEIDLQGGGMRNHRSPEYLRLHGLTEAAINEPHDAWASRLHPDDRARTEQLMFDIVASDQTEYRAEYRIITPAGLERWISAAAEIERDATGRALRMVGAHIDISDAKAAEAAVRVSEARFRAAVSAVRGIVWTNDAEGRMAGPQPGWARLTGQSEAEYQGYGWSTAVHPEDAGPTVQA